MTEPARRPLILHLSSEYLDPLRPPPITDAVKRVVDRMTDFPQVVVSLKRINDPRRAFWRDLGMVDGRRLIVYHYFAPPLGVGMLFFQSLVARRILRFLAVEDYAPAVVHAHRFTFEGVAAWMIARRLEAAAFYSVRGEVEAKIFRRMPLYRPLFRRMAHDAARIYHVSAWFRQRFEAYTGVDPAKTRLLPNIVFNTRPIIPETRPAPRIVTAMSLLALDKKGLPDLLRAFAEAGSALDGVNLEIIGDGPETAIARAQALIEKNGLAGRAVLKGRMENAALLDYFSSALAMAMPSHNETFGMVYPEALFAGTPILYSAGTGIDGYLDGLDVGVGVTPGNVDSIRDGLVTLVRENARYRAAIRENAGELFSRFNPDIVLGRYRADIEAAVKV